MIRKGQVQSISDCDMPAQAACITKFFEIAVLIPAGSGGPLH